MMRIYGCLLLLVVCASGFAAAPPARVDDEWAVELIRHRIDRLIDQLGHEKFERREEASKSLSALGELALTALRKATANDDLEIRVRARRLLSSLAQRSAQKEILKLQGGVVSTLV
jgi:hypothetical protein